ncbi:MAG TPA: DinB family protein [Gemmatimonadales bacterium]|nr:DinB family protein [Gemmatimonadales bacterium]
MNLQAALKNQYHAGLSMLLQAIDACPSTLWTEQSQPHPYWRLTYHTLFYTDLYLRPTKETFVPWEGHVPGSQKLLPTSPGPLALYSLEQMREYCIRVESIVDDAVGQLDLHAPTSGFASYPISKLEHQFVNLRHLQLHVGQLSDTLHRTTGAGLAWRGTR